MQRAYAPGRCCPSPVLPFSCARGGSSTLCSGGGPRRCHYARCPFLLLIPIYIRCATHGPAQPSFELLLHMLCGMWSLCRAASLRDAARGGVLRDRPHHTSQHGYVPLYIPFALGYLVVCPVVLLATGTRGLRWDTPKVCTTIMVHPSPIIGSSKRSASTLIFAW